MKPKQAADKDTFENVARRLGADENPEAFTKALKKIAPPKRRARKVASE